MFILLTDEYYSFRTIRYSPSPVGGLVGGVGSTAATAFEMGSLAGPANRPRDEEE